MRTAATLAACLSLALAGCRAGPSAFDRAPEGSDAEGASVEAAAVRSGTPSGERVADGDAPATGDAATAGGRANPARAADGPAEATRPGAPVAEEAARPEDTTPAATAPEEVAQAAPDDVAVVGSPVPRDDGGLRFDRPEHVRGIYLNAWASGSSVRLEEALEIARTTEINTFVIDIKDASGYVSHDSQVPLARAVDATGEIRIRDLPGLLERLHAEGIYPIARIVVVKDPVLAGARPELAVQDTAGGVWIDGKGIVWLNPWSGEVRDYHVALAREVAALGFPEIQWDYVRFPDAPDEEKASATYPGDEGRPKPEAIRDFLSRSRAELADLGVAVTADVFGFTTSASIDIGIGQLWESLIDVVDVALPMVYPSHYGVDSFGYEAPNAYPYEVVRAALRDALRRSAAVEGAGVTRPWLQDFTLGDPPYGAPEVRGQIQATYDAGIEEWILWNSGSRYTVEALEPVGGFTEEPLLRIAEQVVPLSRRWELLEPAISEPGPAPTGGDEAAFPGSPGSAGRAGAIGPGKGG